MATLQLISNPSRRKRRKARKSKRRIRRNPAAAPRAIRRRRRRSRRASPKRSFRRRSRGFSIGGGRGILGAVKSTIKPAGIAAAGAVALDIVWAYLPLPDTLRAGPVRHVAKFAGAIALGMVVEKVLGKETGKLVTMGAATVVLAGVVREAVSMFAPQLRLAGLADEYPELAYINPAAIENGMGEYMGGEDFDSANLNEYQTL